MVLKTKRYGWKPDLPDHRDRHYALRAAQLPSKVDLRSADAPIYDQGNLGSCTANAIAGCVQFLRMKEQLSNFTPSRLMIYYDERVIEGTVDQDSGAMIRDGIKSMGDTGACPEDQWPYVDDGVTFTQKPSDDAYAAALHDRALQYSRIDNTQIDQMRECLASGFPFVLGFTVYQSFESDAVAKTGIVTMPAPSESTLGGHAVRCVGYNDSTQQLICGNSWSISWGDAGYFYLPYAYAINSDLADDFWTIRLISAS